LVFKGKIGEKVICSISGNMLSLKNFKAIGKNNLISVTFLAKNPSAGFVYKLKKLQKILEKLKKPEKNKFLIHYRIYRYP